MAGTTKKASRAVKVALGKVKQTLGSAIGSPDTKASDAVDTPAASLDEPETAKPEPVDPPVAADEPGDREQEVRVRAYHLWEQDGSPEGREQEYWRRAEAEIEAENPAPPLTTPIPRTLDR